MRLNIVDDKLKHNFHRYLLQVGLATAVLAGVLGFEAAVVGEALTRAVIVAAVASTAFILFITPHSRVARPRRALGGHLVGLAVPGIMALVVQLVPLIDVSIVPSPAFVSYAALAVGGAMFTMAATGTEHPPGAGTALGVVVHGLTWSLVVFVVTSVAMMVGLYLLVRRNLRDLD